MVLGLHLIDLMPNDWISIVFLLIFILLALNNYFNEKRFRNLATLLFNRHFFNSYSKDPVLYGGSFNLFFLPINMMSYSLVIFFGIKYFSPGGIKGLNHIEFIQINILVGLFFAIKFIVGYIFNSVISNTEKFKEFSFYVLNFRNFSSLVLFVLHLIYYYSPLQSFAFYKAEVSILLVFTLFSFIFSGLAVIGKSKFSFFHIILYLCALEIAPTIIYLKFAISMVL